MSECVAVFTLGLSPPIATEFLIGLKERGVECSKAIAVTTGGALPAFHALKIALHWSSDIEHKFPNLARKIKVSDFSSVDLRLKQLNISDIEGPEDCRTFRAQFDSALNDALKWAGGDPARLHVCVAGGRKTMPIDATLVSIAEGIKNVYHVIAPRIPGIAQEFANLVIGRMQAVKGISREALLARLGRYAERPSDADEEVIRYTLEVCFPPKDLKFYLVRIPVPKLPADERRRFRQEI
ncbi:MAG: hypothetical protein DRN06_01950 [Thermoprotei archaeon]|nr:MAG: hypothetical protein DRN06_01950 [Thermoprotei archaeon]